MFNYVADQGGLDSDLKYLIGTGTTLYLWDDREGLSEGDTEKAQEISPAMAKHILNS